jgi:hypothetical protein
MAGMTTVPTVARTTRSSIEDWIDRHSADAVSVREFCDRHRIYDEVGQAIRLAQSAFPNVASISLGLLEDPESGEEWIRLFVTCASSRDETRAGYERYLVDLVAQCPLQARSLIGLQYISQAE